MKELLQVKCRFSKCVVISSLEILPINPTLQLQKVRDILIKLKMDRSPKECRICATWFKENAVVCEDMDEVVIF